MNNWKHYIGQACVYLLLFGVVALLSNRPYYKPLADDQAAIKLSVRHSGKILGECHQRSKEEMAALPANMRIAEVCPRERSALILELDINDQPYYYSELQPSGFQKDGMASLYRRMTLPAGKIKLSVRLKDHIQQENFPYSLQQELVLAPEQVLVIDFNSNDKQFVFL